MRDMLVRIALLPPCGALIWGLIHGGWAGVVSSTIVSALTFGVVALGGAIG